MTRPAVRLPEELRQQIVQHCLAELPNEGCGLFAVDGAELAQPRPFTYPSCCEEWIKDSAPYLFIHSSPIVFN